MRRTLLAALSTVTVAGATLTGVGVATAAAPPDRLAGADRFATAAAIADAVFPEGSDVVYLARADVASDALAAGGLTDGPVLLVPACGPGGSAVVPAATTEAVRIAAPDVVVALGGDAAVCEATLRTLAAPVGADTDRLAGADRYATSVAIAARAFPDGSGTVYLASGADDSPDAVAAGALSDGPVLTVPSTELPAVTAAQIARLAPRRVVALGGPAVVTDQVLVAAAGARPTARLAGTDRYETAVRIAEASLAQRTTPATTVHLARGDDLSDALAGGTLTAGPILLTPRCDALSSGVNAFLGGSHAGHVLALGGPSAVCDDVLSTARSRLGRDLPAPAPVPSVSPEPTPAAVLTASTGTCTANVSTTLTPDRGTVRPGETVGYDVTVRNDPTGSCVLGVTTPTVVGAVDLDLPAAVPGLDPLDCSQHPGGCVTGISMWLQAKGTSGETVLPQAAGLTIGADGTPCAAPGCSPIGQVTVGNVVYEPAHDAGTSVPDAAGTSARFRFFPVLGTEDLELLAAGEARLVVAARTAAGPVVTTSSPLDLAGAEPVAAEATVTVTTPDGDATEAVGDIAPGTQYDLSDVARYSAPGQDVLDVVARATTSYQVASTPRSSTSQATTPLTGKVGSAAALSLALDVSALPAATATTATVSVTSRTPLSGPVRVLVTAADGAGTELELTDDGAGGDLVAGDAVTGGTLSGAFAEGVLQLVAHGTATDGTPLSSDVVNLDVSPAGVPTGLAAVDASVAVTAGDGTRLVADHLLVRFDPASTVQIRAAAAAAVQGSVVGRVGDTWQVRFPAVGSASDLRTLAERLSAEPGVVGVETSSLGRPTALAPNDTRYGGQYAPHRTRTDEAWVVEQGSSVIVAVGDTGIQADHPDLAGRVLTGRNTFDGSTDTAPSSEDEIHGTHVAGIVAAAGGNGEGVAGVNWKARILPITVCDSESCQDDAALAETIRFAAGRGARVLNLSLDGYGRSETVAAALQDAYDANMLVVVAAGNCGDPATFELNGCQSLNRAAYPASWNTQETFTSWFGLFPRTYRNSLVAVASTDEDDRRSSFSNHGDYVDVSAPGSDILSTVPGSGYRSIGGTSMASPFVAGVASLVIAQNAGWTDVDVRARLLSSARSSSSLGNGMGSGRIDAFGALTNSGFETGWLHEWSHVGTANAVRRLGPITPRDGSRWMASISTGPATANNASALRQRLPIEARTTPVQLTLSYDYVTEEYPEWVGTAYNDIFTFSLLLSDGTTVPVATESVNGTTFTPVTGIDFPGGDGTVGQSGWKTVTATIPPTAEAATLVLEVRDVGDDVYDSVVLIDEVKLS